METDATAEDNETSSVKTEKSEKSEKKEDTEAEEMETTEENKDEVSYVKGMTVVFVWFNLTHMSYPESSNLFLQTVVDCVCKPWIFIQCSCLIAPLRGYESEL